MPQGSLSARKKSAAKKKKRLSLRLKRLGRAEMRIARAERAAKKRARAAKRAAKRKLANERANARMPPQSDVQRHLAMLYGELRDKKQPHPDPRTNRRKKTRDKTPASRNRGHRSKTKNWYLRAVVW